MINNKYKHLPRTGDTQNNSNQTLFEAQQTDTQNDLRVSPLTKIVVQLDLIMGFKQRSLERGTSLIDEFKNIVQSEKPEFHLWVGPYNIRMPKCIILNEGSNKLIGLYGGNFDPVFLLN